MNLINNKLCQRCANPFKSNILIKGDDICDTCNCMNDISFWYPKLFRLKFPTPQTILIYTNLDLEPLAYGATVEGIERLVNEIKTAIQNVGLPAFLRTGYLSNKHDWKNSCYLENNDNDNILQHIINLSKMSALATIDRFEPCHFFAVREFIKAKIHFHYFDGEMPITSERRFFIRNGEVECHHSYWPLELFKGIAENKIAALNELSDEDEKNLIKMALYVSKNFSGYWSCDFLKAQDGNWFLTDMAIGESSYHHPHQHVKEHG